jgi:autotransporter-associated beta strand protein
MKKSLSQHAAAMSLGLAVTLLCTVGVSAADKIWDGGGPNGFWGNPANWTANIAPVGGDSLFFTGTTRVNNTNDFGAGTTFNGITFNTPAGLFNLQGSQVILGGGITNNQVVTSQTISLPLALSGTRNVSVVNSASLVLSNVISGAGAGLTKTEDGLLTLGAANTFNGGLAIQGGTVAVGSDANLGAVPGTATPGSISINGSNSTLRSTASFTLNANRGIALGPTSGSGAGIFDVPAGVTLTYSGIMANNGGTGGLTKLEFGGLTLSGANTYTGPTTILNGTATLDFTQVGSPVNNIVAPASALTLGGANAGLGTTNYAALIATPKASTVNSQTFSSTTIDLGQHFISGNANSGGTINISLGLVTNKPGGVVNFVLPTLQAGGLGNITTAATNVNGIVGGWATISDGTIVGSRVPSAPTNWACVDVNGNIVNYTAHTVWAGGLLKGIMAPANNAMIDNSFAATGDVIVDNDGAGSTNDVNTISMNHSTSAGWTLNPGNGNVIRVGAKGALFNRANNAGVNWGIGGGTGGNAGSQAGAGFVTAGGPTTDTAGELVVITTTTGSASGNNMAIDSRIINNGAGAVTLVKAGPGYLKLRNHNSHSGGTYILQGRIQADNTLTGGTPIWDVFGTGDVYIFPGGTVFFSGTTTGMPPLPNRFFIAGSGTQQENGIGAFRTVGGWVPTNTVTLIGDATIGGNGGTGGAIAGKITGPYSLTLGSVATVTGTVSISNPNNDWTGTTILSTRTSGGTAPLGNIFVSGASEIIPNGFGKGNVVMASGTGRTITWNLNGFSETVNGLSHSGAPESCIIVNNGGAPSTLTVGDNDQSGTFGGILQDGSATLALTKIGGGALTLSGISTYSGATTVSGGTLAIANSGSIASSPVQVNSGATLDVSDVAGTTTFNSISVNGGTVVAQTTGPGAITSLNLTAGHVRALTLNTAAPNLQTTTLTTGGATNYIDIVAIGFITGYPAQFPVIKYGGTVGGAGNNFSIGSVPRADTKGFVTNNVANGSIDVVLTAGPKSLTWTGASSSDWDIGVTTNWLAFGVTPVAFQNVDAVFFDDSSSVNAVNLTTTLLPSGISMTNQTRNYSFAGSGSLSGLGRLTKDGVGSLTIANTGVNDFSGGIVLAAGTLQVGNNSTGGNLPTGNVINNGAMVFSRSDNLTETLNISGTGAVSQNGAGILTLGGSSSYQGLTTIAQGTLKASSATALGSNSVSVVINSGGTLDVGGQSLTGKPVTVSGAGVGGGGAIINTGADQQSALLNVSMAGHTTFGGTGRWDIRGTGASLDTGGNAYNLTKVGTNQVSLVGVTMDPALASISVQAGTLSVETTSTSLGNPASTLTVSLGATLQFYGTTTPWDKFFALNGDGVTTTINVANGAGNNIQGAITLAGNCLFNTSAGGNNLTLNGAVNGSGGLTKTGGSFLMLNGVGSYAGNSTVNGGVLVLNNNLVGGGVLSNAVGTAISGQATNTGPVRLSGTLLPGGTNVAGFFGSGALTLNGAQLILDVGQINASFAVTSDQIVANGPLVAIGTNQITLVPGVPGNLTNGQVITIIQYNGGSAPAASNFSLQGAPAGYAFSLVDPATTPNAVRVRVDSAPQVLVWSGGAVANPTAWDIRTTPNWLNTRDNSTTTFTNVDAVSFSDTANTNRVTLNGTLMPGRITFMNSAVTYTFDGTGKLSGTATLDMNGGGNLILANSGSNDFTGAVNIPSGILQVGLGGTNGNLGTGPVTNYGALVFNRAGSLTNTSVIAGAGTVSNIGPGVVTLSGASVYDGETVIAQGTMKAGNAQAFGSPAQGTTVLLGASLDIGGQALTNEAVTVIGAGVGSQGAIVNSGAAQQNALAAVTMTGDTTIGGTGRWDMRGTAPFLSTSGQPFNLTKVGTNAIWLVNVAVDSVLATINVQAGTLGYQESTLGLGNPTNTLTIAAGATLGFYNSTIPMDKVITLNGSGAISTVDVGGTGTGNTILGAVTLNGGCNINCSSTNTLALNGLVRGPGSLTKTGTGGVSLNGTNSYAGSTTVNGGTLALSGSAVLTNSPVITVASGVLDVTGLTAGPTLVILNGQKLAGSGAINGSVLAQPGSTIAPGPNIGLLTVSNTAALQGNSLMELDRSNTNKSDRLSAAAINLGGTLTVTNIGPALQSGDNFTLFSGTLSGAISVSPASLPPLAAGLSWDTSSLNSLGRISVTGTAIAPKITGASVAGGNFNITGSGGPAGAPYRVVVSTNVASPLNSWIPVITNIFDSSGNLNVSIPINPNVRGDFYRVVTP